MSSAISSRSSARRRGFTLIEAIVAIVILALLVPGSVAMLRDATSSRAQSMSVTRATFLATSVIEAVLADVNSPDFGMSALTDANAYLNTPVTGLAPRLSSVTSYYESLGYTWELEISALVGPTGVVTGDSDLDIYRYVRAVVTFPAARATATGSPDHTLAIGALVNDLMP